MTIRVGMIGHGYFGRIQFEAWQRLEGVELVGVTEKSPECVNALIESGFAGKVFDNVETMLSTIDIDVLDISTPPASHGELLTKCVGKVAMVICQKPFCTSLSEAMTMTKLFDGSLSKLVVHENFRFMPWYRKIRDILARGELGAIRQAHFRMRPGDGIGESAYLLRQPYFRQMKRFLVHETGIHWIDVFRFLFGEPRSVFADLWQSNQGLAGEDSGLILFEWETGLRAVFDGNRTLDHAADNHRLTMGEFLVEGENASLSLDGFGNIAVRKRGEKQFVPVPHEFEDRGFGGDCVYHFQKHIVEHLVTGSVIETLASDYLANMRIAEKVYRSAKTGRREIM